MKPFFRHLLPLSLSLLLAIPVPTSAQVLKLKTVVIDPGHGGRDAGCVSRDNKTYEKTVTLDVAKRLEQKIKAAYPDVKVIMTRSTDKFVELENRAVIANKADANLFISIHVNSIGGKATSANGFSVHVLGQSAKKGNDLFSKNLDLVKRENSVIMLEDDYKTKYQGFDPSDPQSYIIFSLMQNAHLSQSLAFAEDVADALANGPIKRSRGVSQDPFWVLWRTTMPSVLVEVGFMTNQNDLKTMRSPEGRDQIAANLLKAMDKRLVLSCHDCSDGGLAIAVDEMCISGQIGAELDLSGMEGDLRRKLYSESNSRWIVEVDGKNVTEFTEIMGDDAQIIGITKGDSLKIKDNGTEIPVSEMRKAWNDPIWNIMGGGSQ